MTIVPRDRAIRAGVIGGLLALATACDGPALSDGGASRRPHAEASTPTTAADGTESASPAPASEAAADGVPAESIELTVNGSMASAEALHQSDPVLSASSRDASIATIDPKSGEIAARAVGTTVLTITTASGTSLLRVTVVAVPATPTVEAAAPTEPPAAAPPQEPQAPQAAFLLDPGRCRLVRDRGDAPGYVSRASCAANEFLRTGGGRCERPGADLGGITSGQLHHSAPAGRTWVVDCYDEDNTGEAQSEAFAVCCSQ